MARVPTRGRSRNQAAVKSNDRARFGAALALLILLAVPLAAIGWHLYTDTSFAREAVRPEPLRIFTIVPPELVAVSTEMTVDLDARPPSIDLDITVVDQFSKYRSTFVLVVDGEPAIDWLGDDQVLDPRPIQGSKATAYLLSGTLKPSTSYLNYSQDYQVSLHGVFQSETEYITSQHVEAIIPVLDRDVTAGYFGQTVTNDDLIRTANEMSIRDNDPASGTKTTVLEWTLGQRRVELVSPSLSDDSDLTWKARPPLQPRLVLADDSLEADDQKALFFSGILTGISASALFMALEIFPWSVPIGSVRGAWRRERFRRSLNAARRGNVRTESRNPFMRLGRHRNRSADPPNDGDVENLADAPPGTSNCR